MSDNKKYYYMKVKETFFDSEEMKILESQKNGEKYQNFYLKLCLLSLKADGALTFKGHMPYDIQMLSTVLRVDIDTVKTGIEIFQKLSLVDILDSGEIYMTDIQSLIGKSSTEAERIQKYRKSIEDKKKCTNVQEMLQDCTPEIEIEIELEKDIDKELNEKVNKHKHSKHKYGQYNHVLLDDEQYNKLVSSLGEKEAQRMINTLDEGIELKGYTYKNHYLAIIKWKQKENSNYKIKTEEIKETVLCSCHNKNKGYESDVYYNKGSVCPICILEGKI